MLIYVNLYQSRRISLIRLDLIAYFLLFESKFLSAFFTFGFDIFLFVDDLLLDCVLGLVVVVFGLDFVLGIYCLVFGLDCVLCLDVFIFVLDCVLGLVGLVFGLDCVLGLDGFVFGLGCVLGLDGLVFGLDCVLGLDGLVFGLVDCVLILSRRLFALLFIDWFRFAILELSRFFFEFSTLLFVLSACL